jgi:uncharacterized phage protein (TIGR01671 family)
MGYFNDEIKFRVWDGKQMLYSDDIGNPAIDDLRNGLFKKVMRFAGFTDKNEKDVYEGDICKIHNTSSEEAAHQYFGYVEFMFAGFAHRIINRQNMYDEVHTININDEVIGNIYENPAFIK